MAVPPIPTLPVKLVNPVTPRVFNEAAPDTLSPVREPNPVILPPTPTLPVVVIVPVEREVEVMAPVFIDVAFNPAR